MLCITTLFPRGRWCHFFSFLNFSQLEYAACGPWQFAQVKLSDSQLSVRVGHVQHGAACFVREVHNFSTFPLHCRLLCSTVTVPSPEKNKQVAWLMQLLPGLTVAVTILRCSRDRKGAFVRKHVFLIVLVSVKHSASLFFLIKNEWQPRILFV